MQNAETTSAAMRDPSRQTAPETPYSSAASALADDLEAVMADGTYDVPGIVAALNVRAAANEEKWTAERLTTELAVLANA